MIIRITGKDEKCAQNLVGKHEGKKQCGRPRRRWEENIKMGPREIGWEVVDRMHPAQNRDQRQAIVNTVMNFRVPHKGGIS